MSEDDTEDPSDTEHAESGWGDRSRGFHFEAGLRPLSDLLGNLVEVTVGEAPPPDDPVDWEAIEEPDDEPRRTDESADRSERASDVARDAALIDSRFEDESGVVVVDVPGASKDDLSVGIDPRTCDLVIGLEGTVLERVRLPWESAEATRVWFNNGVLEVDLRPGDS